MNEHAQKRSKRLLKSSLVSLLTRFITVGSTLVTVPWVLGYLGAESFGVWITLTNLTGYFQFLDFGLGFGLQNALTKCNGTDDDQTPPLYISSAYAVMFSLACLFTFFVYLIYLFIPFEGLFAVSGAAGLEIRKAIFIFALTTIWGLPFSLNLRILSAYQKDYVGRILLIVGRIASLLFILLSIQMEFSLSYLLGGFTFIPVVVTALHGFWMFYKEPFLRPNYRYVRFGYFIEIVHSGFWLLMAQVGIAVRIAAPAFIVSSQFGTMAASQYGVLQKLISLITNTLSGTLQPLWPAYGEAYHRKDFAWINLALEKSVKRITLFSIPISIVLVIWGRELLHIWVQNPEAIPTLSMICAGVLAMVLMNYSIAFSMLLNGVGVIKMQGVSNIVLGIGISFCAFYFSSSFKLNGVVWATLAFTNALILLIILLQCQRFLRINQLHVGYGS